MKEAGEEIAVCRLSHPCSLSIRLVSAAPPETARCRRSPLHRRPSLQGRRGLFSGPWAACPAEAEGSRGGGRGGEPRSPFPGNSAASPSGGERSPAFLGQDSPPPEERNTHAVAGLPPAPGTHRTSSAQYCTSPPGAGRLQPAAAALPPPSPGHGSPPRAPAALARRWQGPGRSPPRAMAAAAIAARRSSPPVSQPGPAGPVRC